MLRSQTLLFCALTMFFSSPSFAHEGLAEEPVSAGCEALLGYTLKAVAGGEHDFDFYAGQAMRGFLGSYPSFADKDAARLKAQGLMMWGHSFAVRKSVAEAKAHDANFNGLEKISYFITDIDVSDLKEPLPEDSTEIKEQKTKMIQERFRQIFATAPLIYWDDSESIIAKKKVAPLMVTVDHEMAARLMPPEKIGWFAGDDRGPRFHQSGWTFMKIRGEIKYAKTFESGSDTIKKLLEEGKKYSSRGYTFTFNQNFQESLDLARHQVRRVKDPATGIVTFEKNSRYLDDDEYNATLESYKNGNAFSIEFRDPSGKLLAGVLGDKHGNLIAMETIFYDWTRDEKGNYKKSLIDFSKLAVIAGLKRLHEHGINIVDAGMVTPFTATLKGEYVSRDEFARDIQMLNAQGPIHIDFNAPFIFK